MLFSIGHSTRTLDDFISLTKKWNVSTIADIRSFPGSKRYPHFNIENLKQSLPNSNINYLYFKTLGGRRKGKDNDNFSAWKEDGFKFYAAYAFESSGFQDGLIQLMDLSKDNNVAMMCSEAVWWRCHRRIIADYAIANDVPVKHILSMTKCDDAKITPFAKPIVEERVKILYTL